MAMEPKDKPEATALSRPDGWAFWLKMLLPAGLLAAINYRQFPLLASDWQDPNWSYGWLIPVLSLYMLYVRRREILESPRCVWPWGLSLVAAGCAAQVLGYWIQNPLICRLSMVLLIFSLTLSLAGPAVAKITWLPIWYLALAFPIPGIYYSRLAGPLQDLAAQGAGAFWDMFGAQIDVAASTLRIVTVSGNVHTLTVEEACAGMRLLTAFLALSVAMAYLADRRAWQKIILVLLGIPVAIVCNIIRVTITCLMFLNDKPEIGKGFMHEFAGYFMLIPAFLLLWLADKLLRGLVVEVDEEDEKKEQANQGETTSPHSGKTPETQIDSPGQARGTYRNGSFGTDLASANAETRNNHSSTGKPVVFCKEGINIPMLTHGALKQKTPIGSKFTAKTTFASIIVLLCATAAAANLSRWTQRLPVAWPTGAAVRSNFTLASLPNRLGPFVQVDSDITGDGRPDGEIVFNQTELKLLGIGSGTDKDRYAARQSNWYSCRIYRDSRITDPASPYRFWRLEIYYYTGIRDLVPHVPERCLAAAGARITDSGNLPIIIDRPGWPGRADMRKTIYVEMLGKSLLPRTFVQYYVFSLNGSFEQAWEKVRLDMSLPWMRRCYFAKIQFAPLGSPADMSQADEKAAEFARYALPAAAANLPTASDVESQNKSSQDGRN